MTLSLLPGIWGFLFVCLVAVYFVRHSLAKREDDHIHVLDSEQQALAAQSVLAHKLDVLDRWKNVLLVLTILSGLAIAAIHLYAVWQHGAVAGFE